MAIIIIHYLPSQCAKFNAGPVFTVCSLTTSMQREFYTGFDVSHNSLNNYEMYAKQWG